MSKANRIERLRSRFADNDLDAFLVTSSENRAYFSGFRGSAGSLWITGEDALLATDFRYTEQAVIEAPDYRVVRIAAGADWLKEEVASSGVRRIGIEDGSMTPAAFTTIKESLHGVGTSPEPGPTGGLASQLPAIQEPDELAVMPRAIALAAAAVATAGAQRSQGPREASVDGGRQACCGLGEPQLKQRDGLTHWIGVLGFDDLAHGA